jgi:hypothetical protein
MQYKDHKNKRENLHEETSSKKVMGKASRRRGKDFKPRRYNEVEHHNFAKLSASVPKNQTPEIVSSKRPSNKSEKDEGVRKPAPAAWFERWVDDCDCYSATNERADNSTKI